MIKEHEEFTNHLPLKVNINEIENRITLKIEKKKTGY